MLSTGPFLGITAGFAALPVLVSTVDIPSGWLQLGLGGAAMFLVYIVLKPLVRSMLRVNERMVNTSEQTAATMARLSAILEDVNRRQDATLEALAELPERIAAVVASRR